MNFSTVIGVLMIIVGLLNCLFSFFEGDATSIILSTANFAGFVCYFVYIRDKSKTYLLTAGTLLLATGAISGLIAFFYK